MSTVLSRFARMVNITIDGDQALFRVEGLHKLWPLRSELRIPLAHITNVEHDSRSHYGASSVQTMSSGDAIAVRLAITQAPAMIGVHDSPRPVGDYDDGKNRAR